ncbi:putative membrane protein [Bradyrhizobium sp. S3.3.6]|uniref:ribosomal maturation YjgA family protein n=1 Tax=Bradyrhizobium sp. S3.3.6 TaxID=3156429 RepID=UPI0033959D6F
MHGAQPVNTIALRQSMLLRAALALIVIACGLSLRWYGFPLGLPAFVVKYGGSLLWATMVFLLIGVLLPRLTRSQRAAIAMVIAIVVELSRLVHTPWLDAFRLTTAGALLLGQIFSLWNLVAYLIGIVAGLWLDSRVASFAQDRILPRCRKLNSQQAGSTRE